MDCVMLRSFAWVMLIILVVVVYAPGRNGALYFDDQPNLGALSTADTLLKKLDFVFSGESGPTGRPLALASFALQQTYWDHDLPVLFSTNIAIHILSGVMLAILALLLASANEKLRTSRQQIAFITSAFWLLSPFLATVPLILVQRMALLSGFFVMTGLSFYTYGRLILAKRPQAGTAYILIGIIPFTIIAVLSKENGILLPLLALVIEKHALTDLPRLPTAYFQRLIRGLLWLPTLIIAAYLVSKIPQLLEPSGRAYTLIERAITQPWILWEYVLNLIIPRTTVNSPFFDDHTALHTVLDSYFYLSITVWCAILFFAYRLKDSHSFAFFGLLFFLAGHLLESSILNLELFFPHRNYVPAFGLYFVMACLVVSVQANFKRMLMAGTALYLLINGLLVWSVTTLWGTPPLAAEMWAIHKESSPRAQHFLAAIKLEEGDKETAQRFLSRIAAKTDRSAMYSIQSFMLCQFAEHEKAAQLDQVLQSIKTARHENGLGLTLELLVETIVAGGCPMLSGADVERIIAAVLLNPDLSADKNTQASIANSRAKLAYARDDITRAIEYGWQAYKISRNLDMGLAVVAQLASNLDFGNSITRLEELREDAPSHLVRGYIWRERTDRWLTLISSEKNEYELLIKKGLPVDGFLRRRIQVVP